MHTPGADFLVLIYRLHLSSVAVPARPIRDVPYSEQQENQGDASLSLVHEAYTANAPSSVSRHQQGRNGGIRAESWLIRVYADQLTLILRLLPPYLPLADRMGLPNKKSAQARNFSQPWQIS